MYDILKIIHLLSIMLGGAATFGSILIARRIRQLGPESAATLGPMRGSFGKLGLIGALLLWLTGVPMFITNWQGFDLGWMFHAKMLFAVILLVAALAANYIVMRAASQNRPPPVKIVMPLGMTASLGAVLAIIFAVIVFN